MPQAAKYFVRYNDETTRGPFDAETIRSQIRAGTITPVMQIRQQGGAYAPARQVLPECFETTDEACAPAPAISTLEGDEFERRKRLDEILKQQELEAAEDARFSRRLLLGAGVVCGVAAIAASVYFLTRGTFERDYEKEILSGIAHAKQASEDEDFDSAISEYRKLVSLVGGRKLKSSVLQNAISDANSEADRLSRVVVARQEAATIAARERTIAAKEDARKRRQQELAQEKELLRNRITGRLGYGTVKLNKSVGEVILKQKVGTELHGQEVWLCKRFVKDGFGEQIDLKPRLDSVSDKLVKFVTFYLNKDQANTMTLDDGSKKAQRFWMGLEDELPVALKWFESARIAQTKTNADGTFAFEDVETGDYLVLFGPSCVLGAVVKQGMGETKVKGFE